VGKQADKFVLALVMKRKSSKGFADYKLVKIIKHKYAIEEENNIPVYLCRKPKINLQQNGNHWRFMCLISK
jgi:hypothetical protein